MPVYYEHYKIGQWTSQIVLVSVSVLISHCLNECGQTWGSCSPSGLFSFSFVSHPGWHRIATGIPLDPTTPHTPRPMTHNPNPLDRRHPQFSIFSRNVPIAVAIYCRHVVTSFQPPPPLPFTFLLSPYFPKAYHVLCSAIYSMKCFGAEVFITFLPIQKGTTQRTLVNESRFLVDIPGSGSQWHFILHL